MATMGPFELVWLAITIGGYLLALLLIPRIVLDKRESAATLAWILFVAIVPYLGAVLFFLVGQTRVRRRVRRRRRVHVAFQAKIEKLISEHGEEQVRASPALPQSVQEIAELAAAVTDTPPAPGNQVEVFIDANQAYDAMEAAIRGARRHALLMSYIYRDDGAGQRFRDLLAEAARRGVEAKLMVDGVGGQKLGRRFLAPLLEAGASFATFMPVFRFSPHWRPNLRNHRKILVVDGEIGFTGGLNIGEEYQGRRKRFAPWRDTHLRVEGPAAKQLLEIFAEDWLFATGEGLADFDHFGEVGDRGEELVQIVDSGPDHGHETIHAVYFTAVNQARERVYITTPYFVPDAAMLLSLKTAAWRGVDVRVLVPGKCDLALVQWAGRSYHKELLQAGVRLWEHRPGVLHAKTMVVDGVWSTIGSANIDRRSFRLNFEANALVSGKAFAERMEAIFLEDLQGSREITLDTLARKRPGARVLEAFARILSPVL